MGDLYVLGGPLQSPTGLNFPSNGQSPSGISVMFQFANPQSDGLPIWGPSNAGATYIWKTKPRQQGGGGTNGYYTAFFWGNDGTYTWNGGGADTYYGAHPYPIGGAQGSTHNWEISVDTIDHQNTRAGSPKLVVYDTWFTQALRVTRNGNGTKTLIFYTALPSTANADVLEYTTGAGFGESNPPTPALSWGDSPWSHSQGDERGSGIIRGIKIFSKVLSEADTLSEAASDSLVTSEGIANIWYKKINPHPDNMLCEAGTGRTPTWNDVNNKATLWTP